jgi:sugar phosphate isomerase/epimerase
LETEFASLAKSATSPLTRFKLGSISDEWSQDFEEALKAMKSYGLKWVEIRTLWNMYNTETTPEQLQRIKDLLEKYEFKVSVLDTAFYKCVLPGTKPVGKDKDPYPYSEQIEVLKRGMERAHALGTNKVRVFSYWRVASPAEYFERIAADLSKAAELARQGGIRLVIENESACNVATGHELARILKLVPAENFGVNWDIGNGYWEGEVSFPTGYAALPKHRIWHMHLKDVRCGATAKRQKAEAWKLKGQESKTSKCATAIVGTGQIDLVGQVRALARDGYQGTMSLEPEYEAPNVTHLQATERSLEGLLKAMATALG